MQDHEFIVSTEGQAGRGQSYYTFYCLNQIYKQQWKNVVINTEEV